MWTAVAGDVCTESESPGGERGAGSAPCSGRRTCSERREPPRPREVGGGRPVAAPWSLDSIPSAGGSSDAKPGGTCRVPANR